MSDIVDSDLRFFKPAEISRLTTNGGIPTFVAFASAVFGNVFPLVTSAEREDGLKDAIKVFVGAASANAASMFLTKVLFHAPVPDSHRVLLCPATLTDDQDDFFDVSDEPDTGYRRYGAGALYADIAAAATSMEIVLFDADEKDGDTALIKVGDRIAITNKTTWDSGTGTYEELIVDTVTPHATLNRATITTTTGTVNAYLAASSKIASIIEAGEVAAELTSATVTTAGDGDYDDSGIVLYNNGTPRDTITLTFTSDSAFTAAGANLGALTGGTTGADWEPLHPTTSIKMLTLPSAGFSGTWAAADTLVLVLVQCVTGVWLWREIPAATAALSDISLTTVQRCESN